MDTRLLTALLLIAACRAEDADLDQDQPRVTFKPGRYVPQLHGATGWYIPDNSGKYRHDPRPYDGGYGDRGVPYDADLSGLFRNVQHQLEAKVHEAGEGVTLGPRDHLRFMIDFNFNGTGWQIIQFQWVRDGDETHPDTKEYSYLTENKLWESDQAAEYQDPDPDSCHVNCEPQTEEYQGKPEPVQEPVVEPTQEEQRPRTNINSEQDPAKIHDTINEVLEYIQQRILPTLPIERK
ncbi:uncharacterized protein LOC6530125 [Drosophila yakuba]|uniref:Uncharacterized protein n=1 Tax=Drosophila yakuba TaxID=7245 RepID=B4P5C1_DROYA|nr:uncharacterized protein LOC6530125 [Drosophila yakuba]EDW90783.1 uncharacterized protein Dyak_GE13455 [Drosophila yakuba]